MPLNPRIVSKTNTLPPKAAAKETITVAISTSGATIARSSSPRTIRTTASTSGITTFSSRLVVTSVSRCSALGPPTIASAPFTACTAVRTRLMVSYSAGVSGAPVGNTEMSAQPRTVSPGTATATPGVRLTMSTTCSWYAGRV